MTVAPNILDLIDDAIHTLSIWDRRYRHAKSCGRDGDVWSVGTLHFGARIHPIVGDWWSIHVYERDEDFNETTLFDMQRRHEPHLSEEKNIAVDCAAAMQHFTGRWRHRLGNLH